MRTARSRDLMVEPQVGDGLSIQEVSRLLQVPAPTIRSWERRYGVPSSGRSTGGHRRFLPEDITSLRAMRDEIARGRRAAEAAVLVRGSSTAESPYQSRIEEFLSAAHGLEAPRVTAVLERAREEIGLDTAISRVLLPGMRQLGVWWQTGRCDLPPEHVTTEAVRAWLNRLLYLGETPEEPELVLLAAGPRDLHTLGLDVMGLLLARRGWSSRSLGARNTAEALRLAVQMTGATALVVASHLSVTRRATVEALHAVEPTGVTLFYAGNAFTAQAARNGVPGSYLGEDIPAAADAVGALLMARRAKDGSPLEPAGGLRVRLA